MGAANSLTKMAEGGISIEYRCTNCGYVTDADAAPDKCPVCKHKETFEKIKE